MEARSHEDAKMRRKGGFKGPGSRRRELDQRMVKVRLLRVVLVGE